MKGKKSKKTGAVASRATKARPKTTPKKSPRISSKTPAKSSAKPQVKARVTKPSVKVTTRKSAKSTSGTVSRQSIPKIEPKKPVTKGRHTARKASLRKILLAKRASLMQQMQQQLGQSLTDDQQRRLEAAMDSGDQALFDLEREMGISLQEMRNRARQMVDEALANLNEGTYGQCAECDAEISEKRLEALPFALYCIECQSRLELMEKIEKGEQRM